VRVRPFVVERNRVAPSPEPSLFLRASLLLLPLVAATAVSAQVTPAADDRLKVRATLSRLWARVPALIVRR
jgi:hypothetical protein